MIKANAGEDIKCNARTAGLKEQFLIAFAFEANRQADKQEIKESVVQAKDEILRAIGNLPGAAEAASVDSGDSEDSMAAPEVAKGLAAGSVAGSAAGSSVGPVKEGSGAVEQSAVDGEAESSEEQLLDEVEARRKSFLDGLRANVTKMLVSTAIGVASDPSA